MGRFSDPDTMTNVVRFTREYLSSIMVEERLLDSQTPDLSMELFGERFSSPIMTPAFSHLKTFASEREDGLSEYSRAAAEMGQVNWVGMMSNEEFARALATGARTIRIIKPYAEKEKIFTRIAYAQMHGAFAVGMDIDHIFGCDGQYDCCMGEMMTRQSTQDLREYVSFTSLPFIVKGILSVQDACKCAQAGVSGIVVSHHHGRMPFAVPPLMALPEIVKALGPNRKMKVFVDCSIDSGYDAFKALALGADAVSVGRAIMPYLVKDGCDGVKACLAKMNAELAQMMAYSGCTSLDRMTSDVLRRSDGTRLV